MKIDRKILERIKQKYKDLLNYKSENIDDPIDVINYIDSNGDSIIHIAVQRGDFETVENLLSAGFNVDQKGDMGCTPLHYASLKKNKEIISLLLKWGANPDINNDFGQNAYNSQIDR